MLLPIDTENINSKKFDTIQFTSYKPLEYKNIREFQQEFTKHLPSIYQQFTKDLPKIRPYLAFYLLKTYQGFTKDLPSLPNTYQKL